MAQVQELKMSQSTTKNNNLSGNFSGATVFNDSTISNAGKIAGGLAKADDSSRGELQVILEQISDALKNRPIEKNDDAEAVAAASEDFMKEADQTKPNPKRIKSLGESFVRTAEEVVDFAPSVIELSKKAVEIVSSLFT
jgi:hypothetical protein